MRILETKKIFIVWSNTDLTEGRGYEYPLYICETEVTAGRLAKGNYVQGIDCRVTQSEAFKIQLDSNRDSYEAGWFAPSRIISPTPEDIQEQNLLNQARARQNKKEEVIKKARSLGLTDEEIQLLKTNF